MGGGVVDEDVKEEVGREEFRLGFGRVRGRDLKELLGW